MKGQIFYGKTYSDPIERYARYWHITSDQMVWVYRFIYQCGLRDIDVRIVLKLFLNKEISRDQLRKFKRACKIYFKLKEIGAKLDTRFNKETLING